MGVMRVVIVVDSANSPRAGAKTLNFFYSTLCALNRAFQRYCTGGQVCFELVA